MARACELYRPGTELLVICEGEPDWLVWCAARPRAAVLGLVHGKWRPEFAEFGRGCSTWAWVGHECDHEAKVRGAIADSATAHGVRLHVRTVLESMDWADMWRAR
jgi:hypothetical protein